VRLKEPGDFENAVFELRPGDVPGGIVSTLVPMVGVRNRSDDAFTWFTEQDISSGGRLARTDIDWTRGIKTLGDSSSVPRMQALLKSQGVAPNVVTELVFPFKPGDEVTVEHEFVITSDIQRALANICFNYLSYVERTEFVLDPIFDPIRNFIHHGAETSLPPVISDGLDILPFKKTDSSLRPVIHFVGITGHHSHRNLLGQVSLFGFMRHTVLLAQDVGDMPEIPYGHFFNVKKKEAQPQPVARRIFPTQQ
jgi:hypothetical protein